MPCIRLCRRRPRLGHEQQVIGLSGGLGCAPSSWLSCGKVLQPVCQDTDRLSKRGDTALERVHAFLNRGRRFPGTPAGVLVHRAPPLAGDVCSGPKAGCLFVHISTAQPGPGGQGQTACCQAPAGHAATGFAGFAGTICASSRPVPLAWQSMAASSVSGGSPALDAIGGEGRVLGPYRDGSRCHDATCMRLPHHEVMAPATLAGDAVTGLDLMALPATASVAVSSWSRFPQLMIRSCGNRRQ